MFNQNFAALVVALAVNSVRAQDETTAAPSSAFTPLASRRFDYNSLPYQADTDDGERGRQSGYNICNSTTQGQESLCQTAIINSIDDFCLWGPQEVDGIIGNVEGEAVAWCTKAGHGTRVIPQGAITGLQFMKTPDYVQVTGLIDQALINIASSDDGGEMDPHGADQRGNPLGGLLFSTAWGGNYVQAVEWHNFMGGGAFCLKACDPAGANAARYCEHIYDRIGCQYNAPARYEEGVFESCQGENQDFPGIYTGADGVVTTYQQPPESLGAITSIPYDARIPASSECQSFDIATLFSDAPSATVSGTGTNTRSNTATGSNTRTTSSRTRTSSSGTSTSTSDGSDGGALGMKSSGGLIVGLTGLALGLILN